jgi:hypothetical protein
LDLLRLALHEQGKIGKVYFAIHLSLFSSDGHFAVIKHAFQVIPQREKFLGEFLIECVNLML